MIWNYLEEYVLSRTCYIYRTHFEHDLQVPPPIPIPSEIGEPKLYMPLHLTRREELTTRHHPSLMASSKRGVTSAAAKTNENPSHPRAQYIYERDNRSKIITRGNARGFVRRGDCAKPWVIYSDITSEKCFHLMLTDKRPLSRNHLHVRHSPRSYSRNHVHRICMYAGPGFFWFGYPFKEVFITQRTYDMCGLNRAIILHSRCLC
jgi:hypothetical protein